MRSRSRRSSSEQELLGIAAEQAQLVQLGIVARRQSRRRRAGSAAASLTTARVKQRVLLAMIAECRASDAPGAARASARARRATTGECGQRAERRAQLGEIARTGGAQCDTRQDPLQIADRGAVTRRSACDREASIKVATAW